MAEEAQKEPTMEEILSSIRKIISEDEKPASAAEPEALVPAEMEVESPVNDDFDDLTLDAVAEDDSFEEDIFESDDTFEADTFENETTFEEDTFELEDAVSASDEEVELPEPPQTSAVAPEPEVLDAPEIDLVETPPPAPQPEFVEKEPEVAVTAKLDTAGLTDATTADAAAGALGQLFSKMDLSSENTIDGLVRELLKPMIKDWLDANLQGIVEAKVEAEVARIARMAR